MVPKRHYFPDYVKLVYRQNPKRSDIYDLDSGKTNFKYFRLSRPRNPWMQSQGAQYVIETWSDKEKVLFSGLIPFKDTIYFGDNKDHKTGRKSFIIAIIQDSLIILYYFNSFSLYPAERKKFISRFEHVLLSERISQDHISN